MVFCLLFLNLPPYCAVPNSWFRLPPPPVPRLVSAALLVKDVDHSIDSFDSPNGSSRTTDRFSPFDALKWKIQNVSPHRRCLGKVERDRQTRLPLVVSETRRMLGTRQLPVVGRKTDRQEPLLISNGISLP